MINPFEQFGFYLEITNDGSPTLRLSQNSERMHHSAGAATETRYIYGSVIENCLKLFIQGKLREDTFNTGIIGLGLGYIEICWALALIKNKISSDSKVSFESYENSEILRNSFIDWVFEKTTPQKNIYELILKKINPDVSINEIQKTLTRSIKSNSLICGDFVEYKNQLLKFHVICYDAFSQQTENIIWEEEFLDQFLKLKAAENCVFTTYACTGKLKRALIKNDFILINRPGFNGKRDSTLAVRGQFKDYLTIFQTF